jgi:hypothetical protein
MSLGEIGKELRLTKERIRQIEVSAMSKLRQPRHAARFVPFLPDAPERLMHAAATLKECHELISSSRRGEAAIRQA